MTFALISPQLPGCGDGGLTARASSMPCQPGVFEVWRVENRGPGEIFVQVDVGDAGSFEPTVTVYEVARRPRNADEVIRAAGLVRSSWSPSDGFPCGDGEPVCPRGSVTLREDAFAVAVGVGGACAGTDARYALTVGFDGEDAELVKLGVARRN